MTIKIATPYSNLFDDPADRHKILLASDILELRSSLQAGILDIPAVFHCGFSLVAPWKDNQIAEIQKISEKAEIEAISFHVLSRYDENDLIDGVFRGRGAPMSEREMFDHAERNTEAVRKIFDKNTPLLLENNNHLGTDSYQVVTEPRFLAELMNHCGMNLLLDIAHARISAYNTHRAETVYLEDLPLHKCLQTHLSRHEVVDGLAMDAHAALEDEDWNYFESLLTSHLPKMQYVTIEYYRDSEVLLEQLERLGEIVHRVESRRRPL